MAPTVAEIRSLVATNDKQRFALKPNPNLEKTSDGNDDDAGRWLIRANQGHSIQIDSDGLLTPITLEAANVPDVVVHGTYFAFWPLIVSSGGLRRMGRNHVHCSTGVPPSSSSSSSSSTAKDDSAGEQRVVSGMRADAELLVYLDVERSLRDGALRWWRSDNGVVLTEGDAEGLVPARYFREVVGRRLDIGTLWRDGEKVADLPAGLKGRVPTGKGRASGGGRGGRGRGGRGRGAVELVT